MSCSSGSQVVLEGELVIIPHEPVTLRQSLLNSHLVQEPNLAFDLAFESLVADLRVEDVLLLLPFQELLAGGDEGSCGLLWLLSWDLPLRGSLLLLRLFLLPFDLPPPSLQLLLPLSVL